MGRVTVKVKLTNYDDLVLLAHGLRRAEEVRSLEVEGLVDTGATMLTVPKVIAEKLGLEEVRRTTVVYGDGRRARRKVGSVVRVEILGREADVGVLIEEEGDRVLVGYEPLEVMDLVVDPKAGTLGPRPESPEEPLIDLL